MTSRLALVLALAAAPALAQPDGATLRALALEGELASVEAAFDAAWSDVRDGNAPVAPLREMVRALNSSDPALAAATQAWLAAEPGSPHARTVRAWQLVDEGRRLRGTAALA